MTKKELIDTINNHRGIILVEFNSIDDTYWLRVSKAEIMSVAKRVDDGQLAATYLNGATIGAALYVGRP